MTILFLIKLNYNIAWYCIQHMANCSFPVRIFFLPLSLAVMPVSPCLREATQGSLRITAFCCCISFLAVYNLSQGDCIKSFHREKTTVFFPQRFQQAHRTNDHVYCHLNVSFLTTIIKCNNSFLHFHTTSLT